MIIINQVNYQGVLDYTNVAIFLCVMFNNDLKGCEKLVVQEKWIGGGTIFKVMAAIALIIIFVAGVFVRKARLHGRYQSEFSYKISEIMDKYHEQEKGRQTCMMLFNRLKIKKGFGV